MLSRNKKRKTPLCGVRKGDKLTNLLPKSIQGLHEDFKQIRRERSEESTQGFDSKSKSRFPKNECEHEATHLGA